jgi:hypothetical protein
VEQASSYRNDPIMKTVSTDKTHILYVENTHVCHLMYARSVKKLEFFFLGVLSRIRIPCIEINKIITAKSTNATGSPALVCIFSLINPGKLPVQENHQ